MSYGNNRAVARPRATFGTAGGIIAKYRHPFLSGQISNASPVDEIDCSRALRLNDTYLDAVPAQDSAFQEPLVDGSVMTITNHLLAGSMTLQVVRTTGLVGTGDLIAAAHLVIASKDSLGGTFTVVEEIDGKRLVTVFYGVGWKNVPHLKKAGNAVVPYPVVMLYTGWVQGVSGNTAINARSIWAVGNKYNLKGVYKPYAIQQAENQNDFFAGAPLNEALTGVSAGNGDTWSADIDNRALIPDPVADGMSATPAPEIPAFPDGWGV
jgi:hypothetical protein